MVINATSLVQNVFTTGTEELYLVILHFSEIAKIAVVKQKVCT